MPKLQPATCFYNADKILDYPVTQVNTTTFTPEPTRRGQGNKIRIVMVGKDVEDSGIEAEDVRSFSANKHNSIGLRGVLV